MRLFTYVERPSALPAALAQFAGVQAPSAVKPAASLDRSDAVKTAQCPVQAQFAPQWVTAQFAGVMGIGATGAAGKDIDQVKTINGVVSGVPPRSRPV